MPSDSSWKLLPKLLPVFRNPVFAGGLGVGRLPPKQKAPGSSPGGGMAGNPFVYRGFRSFAFCLYDILSCKNYGNTNVFRVQTVTQTVTRFW